MPNNGPLDNDAVIIDNVAVSEKNKPPINNITNKSNNKYAKFYNGIINAPPDNDGPFVNNVTNTNTSADPSNTSTNLTPINDDITR